MADYDPDLPYGNTATEVTALLIGRPNLTSPGRAIPNLACLTTPRATSRAMPLWALPNLERPHRGYNTNIRKFCHG